MENVENKNVLISKKSYITLIVFAVVLGVMAVVFSVLYAINMKNLNTTSVNLEKVYQRTFYDLVDSVNNTENKLSKLLATNDIDYANNLLQEINDNVTNAEIQLSYLPISMNGIPETTKFINQIGGYTNSLVKKTKTSQLSKEEKNKLNELYNSIYGIKINLQKVSNEINNGYVISKNIDVGKEDYNKFTKEFQQIKALDQDYPTMIYDGPFSDAVLNKEIKGLNFEEVSKEEAQKVLENIYPNNNKIDFVSESNGKFQTYDFNVELNNIKLYAQITKKGGKLLTVSAIRNGYEENKTMEEAIANSKQFLEKMGIENMQCVWNDKLQADAYLNFAPVINNIVVYPDLIKIKVDLSSGEIIGYEACTYYTNHTQRNISSATISKETAKSKIDDQYKIENIQLVLSPIEYEGEILTYEFKCSYKGSTYYIYINAKTGEYENILKVIETKDGNKLM